MEILDRDNGLCAGRRFASVQEHGVFLNHKCRDSDTTLHAGHLRHGNCTRATRPFTQFSRPTDHLLADYAVVIASPFASEELCIPRGGIWVLTGFQLERRLSRAWSNLRRHGWFERSCANSAVHSRMLNQLRQGSWPG